MPEPTLQTIKKLFVLSGNRCAFPHCPSSLVETSGVVIGEICHIHAKSENGPRFAGLPPSIECHAFENLILLCPLHHKVIDDKPELYTAEVLRERKMAHESVMSRTERPEDTFYAQILLGAFKNMSINNNSGNITINSPNSIQGHFVTVKSVKGRTKIEAPPGSLGADRVLNRYIAHLISRYNEFASKDPSRKAKFGFGAITKNIESNFGARWQLLDTGHAQKVIEYLQARINRTRLARINKGKGIQAYSTLEEYAEKYGQK